jgi:hypothetical protein
MAGEIHGQRVAVGAKGEIPIDLMVWIWERTDLEDRYVFELLLIITASHTES